MKTNSIFNNGFFEFIETEEEFNINGEIKCIKRNMVRRPPGIRGLIVDKNNKKILLSKEYRYELKKWDYRLPGGKVFESLEDYKKALDNNSVYESVIKTVAKEIKEEVGIKIKDPVLVKLSQAGAGVIWDLYFFEITDFEIIDNGQQLEENEVIDGFEWKSYEDIIKMCINQDINEDRAISVLLTYILKDEKFV